MAPRKSITGQKFKVTTLKRNKARKLINEFHVLLKEQASAPPEQAAELQKQIDALGGLDRYQQASISGQNKKRGGDSSKVLVQWLRKLGTPVQSLLEVGCLAVDNECTKSGLFESIDRIDLNSQHPQIEQQDFMERPVPKCKYDCLSLSLVVNFVPQAAGRGEMLYRTTKFLKKGGLLFFVLPEPCIFNSRYMSLQLITQLFQELGYVLVDTKQTARIIYMLLRLDTVGRAKPSYSKKIQKDGPTKNNFAISFQ